MTQNDNRASADSSETDVSDNDEYDSDDLRDVILEFINSDEEDANERMRDQMPYAQGEP